VTNRNLSATKALIANGASPIFENEHSLNPIHISCQQNDATILSVLLTHFAAVKYISQNPMRICHICANNTTNSVEAFSVFVKQGSLGRRINDLDEDGLGMLHYLIQTLGQESIPLLKSLKPNGLDINCPAVLDKAEKTVLELTSVTEVVDWLLAQGATVSKKMLNESNLVLRDRINMEKQWQATGRCFGNSDLH
jgi:ankyrin repeat protein